MCPNPQYSADLVTFTEEILNGKLHFLYSTLLSYPATNLLVDSAIATLLSGQYPQKTNTISW